VKAPKGEGKEIKRILTHLYVMLCSGRKKFNFEVTRNAVVC
jgi:hypothetical protein